LKRLAMAIFKSGTALKSGTSRYLYGMMRNSKNRAQPIKQKTAIPSDSGFGRVFMVAGAGFEPATFRL
jgi:hypothetical protein